MTAAPEAVAQASAEMVRQLAAMSDEDAAELDGAALREACKSIFSSGSYAGTPFKSDTFETCHDSIPALGCQEIQTERGLVHFHEAAGLSTMLILRPKPTESAVGLCLYEPGEDGEKGMGYISQMGPESARTIASSIWRLADQIDGGRRQ